MAATTFTYTANMAEPARAVHAGVNSISWDFLAAGASTKAGTLSDVVLLGKIPAHCTIVHSNIAFGASGAAAIHWTLTAVDANDFTKSGGTVYGSMTQSTALAEFRSYRPTKISLSADSTASHAVLYLNCTTGGSGTVSTSLYGNIQYIVGDSRI